MYEETLITKDMNSDKKKTMKVILISIVSVIGLVLIYLALLNNRYEQIGGDTFFDKWTQERVIPQIL